MLRMTLHKDAITRKVLNAIDSYWKEPRKFIEHQIKNGATLESNNNQIVVIETCDIDEFRYYKNKIANI